MIRYLIFSSILLLLTMGYYDLILRRESRFIMNRFYLLLGLSVSLIAPLITISWSPSFQTQVETIFLDQIVVTGFGQTGEPVESDKGMSDFSWVPYMIWLSVALILFITFVRQIIGLEKYRNGQFPKYVDGMKILKTEDKQEPFSFLDYVYLPGSLSPEEEEIALAHERVHVKQFHSLDRLIMRTLKIIFWFQPLLWIYENRIVENHEFEADYRSVKKVTKHKYLETLLKFSGIYLENAPSMGNLFINSSLKNRINMIRSESKRTNWFKYTAVLPFFMLLILYSCQNGIIGEPNEIVEQVQLKQSTSEEVFKVVEEMPEFPGCENIKEDDERKTCSDKKMLQYIYSKVTYPVEARDGGHEGTSVASFIIEKDGSISEPKILRDPGHGMGDETLRVINSMNEDNIKWKPGVQKGQAVRVQFNIPIKFKIEK